MLRLSTDDDFNFELSRVLSSMRYGAADSGEVLDAAEKIVPGDFASWTDTFEALATRVEASVHAGPAPASDTSIREVMFRAANYWRAADFFIHGNVDDPRIHTFWEAQKRCYDQAIARLPVPAVRFEVPTEACRVAATFYRASHDDTPRPTLIMFNGYDGSQEEMAHVLGYPALDRGINVVTFDGPGQPAVRREQGVGFINEWEKVVTPVLDHVLTLPAIDAERIGVLGFSYGGYLAPRAAAFEPRIAAVISIDGVYNLFDAFAAVLPADLKQKLDAGDRDGFNQAIRAPMVANTQFRWSIEQGIWAFKVDSAYDLVQLSREQTLDGIADKVRCPAFVGDAQHDAFFAGQPARLAKAIGDRALLHKFTDAMSAGLHCQVGATVELNRVVLDWFLHTVKGVR